MFFLGRYTASFRVGRSNRSVEKSIAVLPFESLSEDKLNAYFAIGIQDEILTRLAKLNQLKVISRTSTAQYQSKPGNPGEIAKQLGVAHLLEGSVQRVGEQVRVNVQLINAQNDAHIWADTYDRKLTDIFAVETDIAKSIAEQLQAKLTGHEQEALALQPAIRRLTTLTCADWRRKAKTCYRCIRCRRRSVFTNARSALTGFCDRLGASIANVFTAV